MTAKEIGFLTGLKARSMANPERVTAIFNDEKKYLDLLADLASFEDLARRVEKFPGTAFKGCSDAIILTLAFISHGRESNKKANEAAPKN